MSRKHQRLSSAKDQPVNNIKLRTGEISADFFFKVFQIALVSCAGNYVKSPAQKFFNRALPIPFVPPVTTANGFIFLIASFFA
jgi:hypothetical protein